ncbi:MAG: DEAD/DEAH box helicase [Gammaproteobacteria bacterium]|nr:DEAD/DEAH box helicase [Gammaproteobacteria bacterium]MBT8132958.1 DEAD/DEAH box helicase [Gammaproteobacteria bacterium]NNJ51400.1 DEAD/DEAH box helicase [Gammaproteobacteria bacterium]
MNHHLTETRFKDFDLDPSIIKGLDEAGFEFCTPIQAQSIPIALTGKDVAGEAQTGTGKTAAFMVACLNHLLTKPSHENRKKTDIRTMILAPTRELAIQIHKDASVIGKYTGLTFGLAYGGTDYDKQRRILEDGVDILIGTPGRTIDFFKQRVFSLKRCEVVILDEADRMFDLGFIDDMRYLLRRCPEPDKRLSLLFSATLSHRVGELAYVHMNDPAEIRVKAETKTADKIEQSIYYPANEEKIPLLLGLMEKLKPTRSIVFINTKRVADKVYAWLEGNGYKSALLSGDVPQKKRQSLLKKFQNGEFNTLVATDVAARGLHIPEVSHVFNFDLPQSGEDYVHRIGRTARAGASGFAISFACEDFAHYIMDIEEYIDQKIGRESVTSDLLIEPKPPIKMERRPRPNKSGAGGNRGAGNRNQNHSQRHGQNRGRDNRHKHKDRRR